jgi:hypothetical protein
MALLDVVRATTVRRARMSRAPQTAGVTRRRDETIRVTSARRSSTQDRQVRQRRYLLTQGVRVVCVLLAVLLPVAPHWKIGFIIGSVVLPWFGVVAANAGPSLDRTRAAAAVPPGDGPPLLAIEPGRVIDAD